VVAGLLLWQWPLRLDSKPCGCGVTILTSADTSDGLRDGKGGQGSPHPAAESWESGFMRAS